MATVVLATLVAGWLLGSRRGRRRTERRLLGDHERVRGFMDTAFDAYVAVDQDDRVIEWNDQAQRSFGWTRKEALGSTLHELIVPDRYHRVYRRAIARFVRAGEAAVHRRIEFVARHRSGREFPVELAPWPVRVGDQLQCHAFLHDISERRRQAQWVKALETTVANLMVSEHFSDAAPRVLAAVCDALDWQLGLLWLECDERLCCEAWWHDASLPSTELLHVSQAARFALGQGLPGRVWDSGEPRWVEDVSRDPSYTRAEATLASGLRGSLAFPITRGQEVLGVIELLSTVVHPPDEDLLQKLSSLGSLLGEFLRREKAERASEDDREFLGAVLDNISESIVACDAHGVLNLFNRTARELHKLPSLPIEADRWAVQYDLYEPDGTTPLRTERIPLVRALAGEPVNDEEMVVVVRGAAPRTVVCNGQRLETATGRMLGAVVAMHDVTERKQAEQRLTQLAHFDQLTNLPNRVLFHETLAKTLQPSTIDAEWCVALLLIDLDNFKQVNDTLGHASGDDLLRQVAERLTENLWVRDTVGRLGGDEFGAILVIQGGPRRAAAVAAKLVRALQAPFVLGEAEAVVTASIGIALFPDDGANAQMLMKYADIAMYEAKKAGRNTYRFYTGQMNDRLLARMEMEGALRRALEGGEFMLHYQPKLLLGNGCWAGVEALLRWNRPGHGLVSPAEFVPLLEETGLIIPVGHWVIEEACRQIAAWIPRIGPVRVAVNLSAQQLMRDAAVRDSAGLVSMGYPAAEAAGGLLAVVRERLDRYPEARSLLDFEITESTLMHQGPGVVEQLRELKQLGAGISIDDFGTGYSSLAYLKRFPIDQVKIDRGFVGDVSRNDDDAAIVQAIISLAHNLRLDVVAEGVENVDQLAFLRERGCDQVQGFHVARPMPADDIERLFARK